jgi:hypothetical protein
MARLDSDSLTLVFSFLCGCDFLKAIRVNRRWLQFRFKPAAWPDSRPCGAHMPDLLSAFGNWLKNDTTAQMACVGLAHIDASCVKVLLERGVLERLVQLLARDLDGGGETIALQVAVLQVLFQIGWLNDGEHSERMCAAGVLPPVLRSVRSPNERVNIKAITILGNLCYGGDPSVTIEAAIADDLVPVLMQHVRAYPLDQPVGHPAAALASIAFRGTGEHRSVLLQQGFLPIMAEFVRRYVLRSVGKATHIRLPNEQRYLCDRLTALTNLLRTARKEAVAEGWPVEKIIAIPTTQCGARSEWEAMLEHWHPTVRKAVECFLHEHYPTQHDEP